MAYLCVNNSSWQNISTSICLIPCMMIFRKKPCVMPLLHHNECNWRQVALFQASTCLANRIHFIKQDLAKLTFTNTISIKNYPSRFALPICPIERHQQFPDHSTMDKSLLWILHLREEISYDLFSMTLRRHQAYVLRNFRPIH